MVSASSSLCLLLSLLALLLCLQLLLCWLFSGFVALGWGSAPAVFHGLVLPQVPRPSCLPFFSVSGPPLLSCALSESSRLCCFCLSSCSLGGSVLCFWLHVRVVGSLSLRLFPRSPYLSLLFVPLPLLRLSLDLWVFLLPFLSLLVGGFCGGGSRSSGSGASFLSWLRLSCLSPLVFLLFALFSRLLAFAVSSSFSCGLCVVRPAQASILCSFLSPGLSGVALPSASLFFFASILPGGILEFSFAFSHCPVFCCSCGFAGFCLSCPPLFAHHVRPTSASLSLLLGLLFLGPALVGSSSRALSESLSPAWWLLVSSLWGFSSFRLCSFCRYAASPYVACTCRFSLLLSLLLVSLPCWRLLWFAPSHGLQCML